MIIRRLKQSDKKKWISFFTNLSPKTLVNRYHHPIHHPIKNYPKTIETYWNMVKSTTCLIAEVNDKIVGIVELYLNKSKIAETALTVADEWQHQGIGTKLKLEIEKVAKEMDISIIEVSILPTNIRMKKIDVKLGYKQINETIWRKEL